MSWKAVNERKKAKKPELAQEKDQLQDLVGSGNVEVLIGFRRLGPGKFLPVKRVMNGDVTVSEELLDNAPQGAEFVLRILFREFGKVATDLAGT